MTLGESEGYLGKEERGETEEKGEGKKRRKKRCVLSVSKRK